MKVTMQYNGEEYSLEDFCKKEAGQAVCSSCFSTIISASDANKEIPEMRQLFEHLDQARGCAVQGWQSEDEPESSALLPSAVPVQ